MQKPPCLFTIAIKNIARATILDFVYASETEPDQQPHAVLKLELRKRAPVSDFHRCAVTLISRGCGVEHKIACHAVLIDDAGKDACVVHLMLFPERRQERISAVKRTKTSNEEAFETLAIQAGMYGGDVGLLIEEIEFADDRRPESVVRVAHINRTDNPDPPDSGDFPELTIVQADLCGGGSGTEDPAPESVPEPDIEFDLIEEPQSPAVRYPHCSPEEIFEGLIEFPMGLFGGR